MRPFKFFFAITLGFLFITFIARFVIVALVIATVMSVIFFIGRKFKNFLRNLSWEDRQAYQQQYQPAYARTHRLNKWDEAPFQSQRQQHNYQTVERDYHTIKIH